MEIQVEAVKRIEDGKHEGEIIAIEYRQQPHKYTDIVIEFEEGKKIKTGVPTAVTTESKLGKLLLDFGANLQVGQGINPEDVLVGKLCTFMTMTRVTERGSFANVISGSLRPK